MTELVSLTCMDVSDSQLSGTVICENGQSEDVDKCGTRKLIREDCTCCPQGGNDNCTGPIFAECLLSDATYADVFEGSISTLTDRFTQL